MKLARIKIYKRPLLNSLKKHRKLLKYTQKDVARLLDLQDTSQISRWEKGLSFPNTINLLKLSIIYRTFPNELYFDLLVSLRHDVIKMEKIVIKKEDY
jgi:transcriptional regulator with XRE-family HTH domain